ncbi:K(lysine) acetyltransferase [Sparganum proliferum]
MESRSSSYKRHPNNFLDPGLIYQAPKFVEPTAYDESSGMAETSTVSIGDNFKVRRHDGQLYPACILETRLLESGDIEYFVHYLECDRRLDEWVTIDRIEQDSKFTSSSPPDGVLKIPGQTDGRLTRNQKRRYDEMNHVTSELDTADSITQRLEKEHQKFTRVKFIDHIRFGKYEIGTWYFSPYPEEYRKLKYLWICEFCLKYMKFEKTWVRHMLHECRQHQPPGREIYKKDNIRVFEVDGDQHKLYCQNLCLLAKLFLDHKTLYYDVAPFLFYVLCEVDTAGCHVVGYFSKERFSVENNNLACILTLPPFQRRGYGKFLIGLSYELAKIENLIGSPEKPLSDLGRLSYKSYWEKVIFSYLLEYSDSSIEEISAVTCIAPEDIIWTLQSHHAIKYWRHGRHIELSQRSLQDYLSRMAQRDRLAAQNHGPDWRPPVELDVSCIRWTPSTKVNKPVKRT